MECGGELTQLIGELVRKCGGWAMELSVRWLMWLSDGVVEHGMVLWLNSG